MQPPLHFLLNSQRHIQLTELSNFLTRIAEMEQRFPQYRKPLRWYRDICFGFRDRSVKWKSHMLRPGPLSRRDTLVVGIWYRWTVTRLDWRARRAEKRKLKIAYRGGRPDEWQEPRMLLRVSEEDKMAAFEVCRFFLPFSRQEEVAWVIARWVKDEELREELRAVKRELEELKAASTEPKVR